MLYPRSVRRHLPGPGDFAARLAGRRVEGARRRGKYLWLPLDSGDAILGHLGMSGQLLVLPSETPSGRTCGSSCGSTTVSTSASSTSGPSAACSLSDGGADGASRDRAYRAGPAGPAVRRCGVRARGARVVVPASSGHCSTRRSCRVSATSTPTRRCGRPGCTTPARPRRCAAPRSPGCCSRCGPCSSQALGEGGTSFDCAVRQRQRGVRLLRPVAGRLRARGRALPPLRYPDPARRLHEPIELQLPALPAPATTATPLTGTGRPPTRARS